MAFPKSTPSSTKVEPLVSTGFFCHYRTFPDYNFVVIDVRKLAGRLICEALYKSSENQDFFCGLFDIDCTYGHVSINQGMPILIK